MDTVASAIYWAATSGFVVSGFMSSDGRYLGDPVVDPQEVGVFSELGDDVARADPLSRHAIMVKDMKHYSGVLCTRLAT
jgi:hypothetical protein